MTALVTVHASRSKEFACARRTLVYLAGNGNEIAVDVADWDQVVVFTWSRDHTVNPKWLPGLLLHVCRLLASVALQPPDIAACSRGVQGFLCACADSQVRRTLPSFYDRVALAGGCLWEAGGGEHARNVCNGLGEMRSIRGGRAPVFCVVASQMDSSVDASGNVSKVAMCSCLGAGLRAVRSHSGRSEPLGAVG